MKKKKYKIEVVKERDRRDENGREGMKVEVNQSTVENEGRHHSGKFSFGENRQCWRKSSTQRVKNGGDR